MNVRQLMLCGLSALVLATTAGPAAAGQDRPFRGQWEGSTISAMPVEEGVVLVVSAGTGRATHLGRFEMISPHLTFLQTFELAGEHNYTAANGDQLFADFSGQLTPNPDGSLEGTLESTIIGGTGRCSSLATSATATGRNLGAADQVDSWLRCAWTARSATDLQRAG
jgi:hypothetical protein